MKTKKIFLLAALFASAYALNSCFLPPAEMPECKSNCAEITIAGKLRTKPDNQPVANVPIGIHFRPKVDGRYVNVAEIKSDRNGVFKIQTTVDTSAFKSHSLIVEILNADDGFVDSLMICPADHWIPYMKRFPSFDRKAMENILFEFFLPVDLTFNVLRTTVDSIVLLHIIYDLGCGEETLYRWVPAYGNLVSPPLSNSFSSRISVGENLYTKIRWGKKVFGKGEIWTTDSIFCERDSNNVYTINF